MIGRKCSRVGRLSPRMGYGPLLTEIEPHFRATVYGAPSKCRPGTGSSMLPANEALVVRWSLTCPWPGVFDDHRAGLYVYIHDGKCRCRLPSLSRRGTCRPSSGRTGGPCGPLRALRGCLRCLYRSTRPTAGVLAEHRSNMSGEVWRSARWPTFERRPRLRCANGGLKTVGIVRKLRPAYTTGWRRFTAVSRIPAVTRNNGGSTREWLCHSIT